MAHEEIRDGNTSSEVLAAGADESARLRAELAATNERLSKYEGDGIIQGTFNGEVPRYRLNSACFLEDDTLHVEGEEIEYLNTPNTEMVPINDAARKRMTAYLEEQLEGQQAVAIQNGRQPQMHVILDRGQLMALSGQDARNTPQKVAVMMPEDKGMVYPMPHMPETVAQQKRRGRPPKSAAVVSTKAPPPPERPKVAPERILGGDYNKQAASNTRG